MNDTPETVGFRGNDGESLPGKQVSAGGGARSYITTLRQGQQGVMRADAAKESFVISSCVVTGDDLDQTDDSAYEVVRLLRREVREYMKPSTVLSERPST